jgi:hypothetical protein
LSTFEQFARERGLEVGPSAMLDGPFWPLGAGDRQRVVAVAHGALAPGRNATLAVYAYFVSSPDGRDRAYPFTIVLCDVPESAAALPWLECRSREAELLGGRPLEPDRGLEAVRLESEFFEQRFLLLAGPGTDPVAVAQLFAPSFLHWFAYEAPFGFSLELVGGRLCASVPGEPERLGPLGSFWDSVARIVEALVREGREDERLA